jgi:ankyrin repeat protein
MIDLFRNFTLIILTFLTMLGCSNGHDNGNGAPMLIHSELSTMTREDRQAHAPNPAFEAVYYRDTQRVADVMATNPEFFNEQNVLGLTPLMLAITLQESEMALAIANNQPIQDLQTVDLNGRGALSYAAQFGEIEVLEAIGKKYEDNLGWSGLNRFINIDVKDHSGRRALFYAADSSVAEALSNQWTNWAVSRWFEDTLFSSFINNKDFSGQNFIHAAAADNRHDLLRWANDEICFRWAEGSEAPVKRFALTLADYAGAYFQDVSDVTGEMFNKKDDNGDTPLHLAVKDGNLEASRILMNCWIMDFNRKNNLGHNPLSNLLAHLDPDQNPISENYRQIFNELYDQQNEIIWWRPGRFKLRVMNDKDKVNGDSALHHAARLKDPYFYETLMNAGGNIYLENDLNQTPDALFRATQQGQ